MDDDVEIKIEYFETYEEDPLREIPLCVEEAVQLKETQCEEKGSAETSAFTEDFDNLQSSSDIEFENEVDTNNPTWYEAIDKTGKYLCKFCSLTYFTIQTLRRHVLTKHTAEGIQLRKEVAKNKRKSKLKCYICRTNFAQIKSLKEHMKTHKEVLNSYCHICQATFPNDSLMSTHLLTVHKKLYKTIYKCNMCGYRTGKLSHLKQHEMVHSKRKVYECETCDYATNRLSNMKIHEGIHSKFSLACPHMGCDYSASTKAAFRSHQLRHKGAENNMLYCTQCPYKTVYKQSLKNHCDSHNRNSIKIIL